MDTRQLKKLVNESSDLQEALNVCLNQRNPPLTPDTAVFLFMQFLKLELELILPLTGIWGLFHRLSSESCMYYNMSSILKMEERKGDIRGTLVDGLLTSLKSPEARIIPKDGGLAHLLNIFFTYFPEYIAKIPIEVLVIIFPDRLQDFTKPENSWLTWALDNFETPPKPRPKPFEYKKELIKFSDTDFQELADRVKEDKWQPQEIWNRIRELLGTAPLERIKKYLDKITLNINERDAFRLKNPNSIKDYRLGTFDHDFLIIRHGICEKDFSRETVVMIVNHLLSLLGPKHNLTDLTDITATFYIVIDDYPEFSERIANTALKLLDTEKTLARAKLYFRLLSYTVPHVAPATLAKIKLLAMHSFNHSFDKSMDRKAADTYFEWNSINSSILYLLSDIFILEKPSSSRDIFFQFMLEHIVKVKLEGSDDALFYPAEGAIEIMWPALSDGEKAQMLSMIREHMSSIIDEKHPLRNPIRSSFMLNLCILELDQTRQRLISEKETARIGLAIR